MPLPAARSRIAVAAALLAAAALAVPALGGVVAKPDARPSAPEATAAPGATAAPAATDKPGNGPPVEKPGRGPRAGKGDRPVETPVELTGRIGTRTGEDGRTVYTLTAGATSYDLAVGPPWFWGEAHPLAPFAGRTVTVAGDQAEGATTIDVRTVDGTTIRAPGRPPWAGGPKAVGEDHPGWKPWKSGHGTGKPPWAGPRTPDDGEGE